MANASRRIDLGSINRLSSRLAGLDARRTKQVVSRATVAVQRRWQVDAPRLVASEILNITPARLREYLSARVTTIGGDAAVVLSGLRKRIPLHLFTGARYGGRNTEGAVVQVWRDSPAKIYARTFTIGRRGVAGGIYQRAPRGGVVDDLHGRLPIIQRSGPELWRAVTDGSHGDVRPQLIETARKTFRAEIERLLKVRT
jgi:hypothetical protein